MQETEKQEDSDANKEAEPETPAEQAQPTRGKPVVRGLHDRAWLQEIGLSPLTLCN